MIWTVKIYVIRELKYFSGYWETIGQKKKRFNIFDATWGNKVMIILWAFQWFYMHIFLDPIIHHISSANHCRQLLSDAS